MALIMQNNIFEWGERYFLQLLGTTMGTSFAYMWATIYFAVHEIGKLLPTYGRFLLLFKRFIDDMFGIWIGDGSHAWLNFKAQTNNFEILTWEFEEPSTSVGFLDLTISIEDRQIQTRTFQISINLYQYLPPQSAHPPSMMRGIIYSLMKDYPCQNSSQAEYEDMAIKLFKRHVTRG
ncbi:hypothetical protein ACHAWF_016084 [Thalassiosira exigua]